MGIKHSSKCTKVFANRTKTFHVKHFGPVLAENLTGFGRRPAYELVKREGETGGSADRGGFHGIA
jgi:hypothetical protein